MPDVYRVYADENRDTHLAVLELPTVDQPGEGAARVRGLLGIPALTLGIVELVERMPGHELHPAPERRLLALLRGEYEIVTNLGEACIVRAGDCLLADDVGSNGHRTREVGDERVMMVSVQIPDDWECPGS
jgi:mannose-6-phosphate isomerase-like protein (cupin superfamily)